MLAINWLNLFTITILSTGSIHDPVVSLNNSNSFVDHEITVQPGETFSTALYLDATQYIGYLGVRMQASESYIFEMDSWALNPDAPRLSYDVYDVGPFEHVLLDGFEIRVLDNVVPGDYSISIVGGQGADCPICDNVILTQPGPDFLVTVVPEPSTWILIFMGAAVMIGGNRFKQRKVAAGICL